MSANEGVEVAQGAEEEPSDVEKKRFDFFSYVLELFFYALPMLSIGHAYRSLFFEPATKNFPFLGPVLYFLLGFSIVLFYAKLVRIETFKEYKKHALFLFGFLVAFTCLVLEPVVLNWVVSFIDKAAQDFARFMAFVSFILLGVQAIIFLGIGISKIYKTPKLLFSLLLVYPFVMIGTPDFLSLQYVDPGNMKFFMMFGIYVLVLVCVGAFLRYERTLVFGSNISKFLAASFLGLALFMIPLTNYIASNADDTEQYVYFLSSKSDKEKFADDPRAYCTWMVPTFGFRLTNSFITLRYTVHVRSLIYFSPDEDNPFKLHIESIEKEIEASRK